MWQQYLMQEASKTDDPQTKSMMMMMMMQAMQQQQASSKASKKNKENEDKKEEKSAAEKMPTPGPMPSMAATPPAPQENLKLVEEAAKADEAERAKKAEAEKEQSDPIADMLVPFTPPKVDLGLNKPSPTPAPEEKEAPSLGEKTALGAIQAPKGENLNFANSGNGTGNGTGLNNANPSLMGVSKNSGTPAQEVVGAERAVASTGEESAKGNVRKTTEQAGGDSDGGDEGSSAKGEAGGGDSEFFASLMAKMNGEDAMMEASSGMGSEGDTAAGESAPMSIFEFASMRYRRAANEEGRLRPLTSKKAEAAMR